MDSYFKAIRSGALPADTVVLLAHDDATVKRMAKVKLSEVYRVTIKRQRNYKLLQKAHCLVNFAFDCQTAYLDKNEFRKAVTIEAGFSTMETLLDGRKVELAKSWAFENMSEDSFEDLYSAMIDGLCRHADLFGGMTRDQFLDGISSFAGNSI